MQNSRADYLKAMGVDIYVHRQSVSLDATDLEDSTDNKESLSVEIKGVENKSTEVKSTEIRTVKSVAPSIPVTPILVDDLLDNKEDLEALDSIETITSDQANKAEPVSESQQQSAPLYFLWQQSGSSLFLSAQSARPDKRHAQLLDAIARSIGASEVHRGEGKWPLIDSGLTSELETREFLTSFVQGRSSTSNSDPDSSTGLTLVLLGEESAQHFIFDKDFEEVLGSKIARQGVIREIRPVPSLDDMLSKPQLKSVTWQSICDLKVE